MARLDEWITKIFGRNTKSRAKAADMLIYKDPRGQAALISDYIVNCIVFGANQISKGKIKSVVVTDTETKVCKDSITRLFRFQPNSSQVTSDFLKCAWDVYQIKGDLFIYPEYDLVETVTGATIKKIRAFHIIPYSEYSIDGISETITFTLISYLYGEQKTVTLPLADVAHMKNRRAGINPLCGGDTSGRMDYSGLERVVRTLSEIVDGIGKNVKSSYGVRGLYQADSSAGEQQLSLMREALEGRIAESEYGFLYTNLEGKFTPINSQLVEIDPETMKTLQSVCYERFGISAKMLSGNFTSAEYNAFYQTALEPFIVELEQVLSAVCFTQREQDLGHEIRYYGNLTYHFSVEQKTALAELSMNTGLYNKNEVRSWFGDAPIPGGDKFMQSLNFVDTNIANKYQLGTTAPDAEPQDVEPAETEDNVGEEDNGK